MQETKICYWSRAAKIQMNSNIESKCDLINVRMQQNRFRQIIFPLFELNLRNAPLYSNGRTLPEMSV